MAEIYIVGLGPGDEQTFPLGNWQLLKGFTGPIIFRTYRHPIVDWLKQQGITGASCDHFYEEAEDFAAVYEKIVQELVGQATQKGQLAYCVPGHPLVAETSVQWLLKRCESEGITVRILPAMSFLDAIYAALKIDPAQGGLQIIDALALAQTRINPRNGLLLLQVYNQLVASETKLTLMEFYPDEYPVTVIRGAGLADEKKVVIPLYELDRLPWIDHLTSIYLAPNPEGKPEFGHYALEPLATVMEKLRSEQGCPWDREQTHQSLKPFLIEEAYEVLEAIDNQDMEALCEELGDVLLQVVFHTQIAREHEYFDLNDVIMVITEKMIRRHPHVFADTQVADSREVIRNWEQIKAQEKKEQGKEEKSLLAGVPRSLPALLQAYKLQAKAAKVGFDWDNWRGAWDKVQEELRELGQVVDDRQKRQEELGDLLFALVNLARFFDIDPEEALKGTCSKFRRRFAFIEQTVRERGQKLEELALAELDKIWELAKNHENISKKNG